MSMSTKSHFIYSNEVEGYEETIESQSIFGKHTGYNSYLIWKKEYVHAIEIKGEYIYLQVKAVKDMPSRFRIWGDAILQFEYDVDGLLICLKGGHHITKQIIKNQYDTEL